MARNRLFVLLIAAVVLIGCSAPATFSQQARSERYMVTLTLDTVAIGERRASVEVRDQGGAPVPQAEVRIVSAMAEMGHGSQVLDATPIEPGNYRAQGALFTMPGVWQLAVVIRAGGTSEAVQFQVKVQS